MESTATHREVSPRLLTIPGAAAFLGVSPWSVRALIWDGCVPFVIVGRAHMIDREDLIRWLETHKERAGMGTMTGTQRIAAVKPIKSGN